MVISVLFLRRFQDSLLNAGLYICVYEPYVPQVWASKKTLLLNKNQKTNNLMTWKKENNLMFKMLISIDTFAVYNLSSSNITYCLNDLHKHRGELSGRGSCCIDLSSWRSTSVAPRLIAVISLHSTLHVLVTEKHYISF